MMAEWGVPFHEIESEWTDRQFLKMADMLADRLRKQSGKTGRGKGGGLVGQLRAMGVAK